LQQWAIRPDEIPHLREFARIAAGGAGGQPAEDRRETAQSRHDRHSALNLGRVK
jgi:hypothetical protein